MIFRYYREIHFYTYFCNSNSRKKISWRQKNFIFEGRFLYSNTQTLKKIPNLDSRGVKKDTVLSFELLPLWLDFTPSFLKT